MFDRILWFILLVSIAVLIGIFGPNGYKTIECNNTDKICKVYNINAVLNTKNLKKSVNVASGYGQSWYIGGVGQNHVKNLACRQQPYTVIRRDGTTENKIKYILVPINKPKPTTLDVINEYMSNTSCEVDRVAIQTYLSSNNTEPFVYVVAGSKLRYLWYLVSAILIILAFGGFKGRVLSEAEVRQLQSQISEEEIQQMHNGVKNIIKLLSKIDQTGADAVNKVENKVDKYHIDIKNDEN